MKDSIDLSSIEFRVGNSDGKNTPEIYCPNKAGDWNWRSMAGIVFPSSYSKHIPNIPGISEIAEAYPVFRLYKLHDKLMSSNIFLTKDYFYTSFKTLYSNVFVHTTEKEATTIVNCVRSWFSESLYELKKFHGQESNPAVTGFDTVPLSSADRGNDYFIDFTNIKVELHRDGPGVYSVQIQLIKDGVFGDSKKFFNFFSWILPENFGEEIDVKPLRGYIKDYGRFTIKSLEEELSYDALRLDDFYSETGDKKVQLFRIRSIPYGNKIKRAVKGGLLNNILNLIK
jgi:hypothetical protein